MRRLWYLSRLLDSSLTNRNNRSGRKYLLRSDGGDAMYWPGTSFSYAHRNTA